jgi:hypothetical protein
MKRQMVFKGIKFHKKAIRGVQLWVYDRCAQLSLARIIIIIIIATNNIARKKPPLDLAFCTVLYHYPLLKKKLTTRTSSVRECVVNTQC